MFSREGRIGCMLWTGLGLMALGFALSFVMMLGGLASVATGNRGWLDASVVPLSLVVVGALLCAFNLFRMWWIPFSAAHSTSVEEIQGAYIIAKTAFDQHFNMTFPTEPEDGLRYFITLRKPHGPGVEYRTSEQTFFAVGEGMAGTASVQGDWLGMFIPSPPEHALGD